MIARIIFVSMLFFSSQIANAAIHFGVSGSAATTNLGLEVHRSQAGKASVAVDLGSYFRLSLSGQYKVENEEGHKDKAEEKDDEDLVGYEARTQQASYALDLIAVLYAGELFTPFIFVGAAIKSYNIVLEEEGDRPKRYRGSYPAPNYGAGLAISLNRNFSLKITNTWSVGQRVNPDNTEEVKAVRDLQTDIGLSYKFE